MTTALLPPALRPRPAAPAPAPMRRRTDLPAHRPAPCILRPAQAVHDFLVPNPRPDLALDRRTLLMLEAG